MKVDRKTMAGRVNNNNRRKPGFVGTREQTQCRFCRRGINYIDYKDIGTLQKLLTNRGKIYSRKRSGNCASCQRKAKKASLLGLPLLYFALYFTQ